MTAQTERLDVVQVVGHSEVGEAVDGADILGITPEAVKAVLSRQPADDALADKPEIAGQLTSGSGLLALSYTDTPSTFAATYAQVRALLPLATQMARQFRIPFDLTAEQYGGYQESRILKITDDGDGDDKRPLKTALDKALPEFLKRPAKGDSIIVYFSGHGFRDKSGRLYLAPLDIDPTNPVATGMSAKWFRGQLEVMQLLVFNRIRHKQLS